MNTPRFFYSLSRCFHLLKRTVWFLPVAFLLLPATDANAGQYCVNHEHSIGNFDRTYNYRWKYKVEFNRSNGSQQIIKHWAEANRVYNNMKDENTELGASYTKWISHKERRKCFDMRRLHDGWTEHIRRTDFLMSSYPLTSWRIFDIQMDFSTGQDCPKVHDINHNAEFFTRGATIEDLWIHPFYCGRKITANGNTFIE